MGSRVSLLTVAHIACSISVRVCVSLLCRYGGSTIFIESSLADSASDAPAALTDGLFFGGAATTIPTSTTHPDDAADDEDADSTVQVSSGGGGRGGFFCTGSLGSVMKESSSLAYTITKRLLADLLPSRLAWFQRALIHIHFPTGSQPKDGPSAGIGIALSLLSLASGRPVLPDLAVTGELTLTGQVSPVGGIKEKLLAAKRARVSHIILPAANRAAVAEVAESSPELVEDVRIHYVSHIREVLPIAFPDLRAQSPSAAGMEVRPPSLMMEQQPTAVSAATSAPAATIDGQ